MYKHSLQYQASLGISSKFGYKHVVWNPLPHLSHIIIGTLTCGLLHILQCKSPTPSVTIYVLIWIYDSRSILFPGYIDS